MEVHLLCIGKLKDEALAQKESQYTKRLTHFKFHLHELKSHSEDRLKEAQEIEKKILDIQAKKVILLTETGKTFTSPEFGHWFFNTLEKFSNIAFVIGGSAGFAPTITQKYQTHLSLGSLTYPHKIARLLIIEQLYRAQCLKSGHPYHK